MSYEVTLLTSRMSWFIGSQSFLFAANIATVGNLEDTSLRDSILILAFPIIAIALTILTNQY